MSLFRDLIANKFLANASGELQRAKAIISEQEIDNFHTFILEEKKELYYFYFEDAEFYRDLMDISLEEAEKDLIYIVNKGTLMFCFSMSKKQIDETIMFCHNLNGDIPIHRTKHLLQGKYIHTVMFDTSFILPPQSPN